MERKCLACQNEDNLQLRTIEIVPGHITLVKNAVLCGDCYAKFKAGEIHFNVVNDSRA